MAGLMRSGLHAAAARPVWTLAALTLVLLFVRGSGQSFWAFDEGWYAQQARWILQNNDWITQHWWGSLQYDRGMGVQWLIAASYALFGYSETTARLPSMMAALGCVLLTYSIARECVSRRTAILAAAILAVTPIWMQAARLATQDIPLVFFELLGIWALLRAERPENRRIAWGVLAGATIGLGFMIKTFMVVPALVAMAPYLLLEHRRHRHLFNPGLYVGLLLGFVPFLVWIALSTQAYGWYPLETLFGKLLILSGEDFHGEGPFYYFWNLPANAFPWPLLALPGIVIALRGGGADYRRRWLWIGYPVLLFAELTLFSTRVWYYALQLLPFLSIAAAVALIALADAYEHGRMRLPAIATMMIGTIGLVLAGLGAALLTGLVDMGLQPAWAFGLLGLAGGFGWIVPLAIMLRDRNRGARASNLWLGGWLLGPWLAILVAFATGLWGNYGSYIKIPLQDTEIARILDENLVDFVLPGDAPGRLEDIVLLTLYTPRPNRRHPDLASLPDGIYAWVHDETLKTANGYELIGSARGWNLVRMGGR
jgi:4-amino-4-deoxy-L-arabinose transferase-like glycosyltransferase